jgi:hypothetical protein
MKLTGTVKAIVFEKSGQPLVYKMDINACAVRSPSADKNN